MIVLAGTSILVTYTLLPWIAVMAAGFCFGRIFQWEPEARQAFMRWIGLACIAGFFVLRAINRYGDPVHGDIRNLARSRRSRFSTAQSTLHRSIFC